MDNTKIINKFGTMQGWSCITINLMGRDLEGVTEIAYDDTVEMENAKGAGLFAVGRAVKGYEAVASITLYKEEIDALQKSLPKGKRIQEIAPFDIIVEYAGNDGVITKDIIKNVQFVKRGVSAKQGDGTVTQEVELIISSIDWDVI